MNRGVRSEHVVRPRSLVARRREWVVLCGRPLLLLTVCVWQCVLYVLYVGRPVHTARVV